MAEKKSLSDKWNVLNLTDGILASPEAMTKQDADRFIEDFPKKYLSQGFYLTASGEKIRPEKIILKAVPIST